MALPPMARRVTYGNRLAWWARFEDGRIEAQLAMRGETRDPRLGMASVEALQKHLASMQKSP